MTSRRPSTLAVMTALVLVTCAAPTQAQTPAHVVSVAGEVEIKRAGRTQWQPLPGWPLNWLHEGDELQTMQDASAKLVIGANSHVIKANSHVVIPTAAEAEEKKTAGLWHLIGEALHWILGERHPELGDRSTTAAPENTLYASEVDEDGAVTITVLEGNVAFFNDAGRVMVRAGEQSTAWPGDAPTRPMQFDTSGFFEWEASIKSIAPEWESESFPGATRDELEAMLRDAGAAVEAGPTSAEARARLAAVHLDLAHPIMAAVHAQAALDLGGAPASTSLTLGRALLRQSQVGAAIEAFEAAADSPELASPAQIGIAAAHAAAGRDTEAEAALAAARTADPGNATVDALAGLLAMRRGDLQAADRLLHAAASAEPSPWQAQVYLADLSLVRGDGEAARSRAMQAVETAPGSPLARRAAATVSFYTADAAGAREQVELALTWDPTSARAHLLKSHLLVSEGDIDAALREAEAAVAFDPTHAPAHSAYGTIQLAEGAIKRAEYAFGYALDLDPMLVSAQTGMGLTWAAQGRMAEAMRQHKAAISLDADAASAWNNLGATHLALGQLDRAIDEFERALQLQPQWAIPHANMAISHLEANRFALALEHAQRARELGGESARVLTTLGRVFIEQGRISRAQVALRRALALDPDYALAHLHLAEVYVAQGRPRDALSHQLEGITEQPAAIVDTREYSRTEATLAGGSVRAEIKRDGRGNDGQNSYLLHGAWEEDQERGDAQWRQATALAIGGRQRERDRADAAYLSVEWQDRDRPGRALPGGEVEAPNYESEFTGLDLKYLARIPASERGEITLKAGYLSSRVEGRDPDAMMGDRGPIRRLEVRQSGLTVEARLDQQLSEHDDLIAGVALFGEERRVEGRLGVTGPRGAPRPIAWHFFEDVASRDAATFHGWYTHRAGDATSLTLGGRMATREGMEPVLRPEGWVRHDVSRDGTLVLLTRPLLRDDVSELAPINDWASRPWISPLDLATGGYAQSWEAVCELTPDDGSVLRGTAFFRSLENLIWDLEDPALSPGRAGLVVASGEVRGGEIEWERWLGDNLSAGIFVRYSETENDDAGGNELPLYPEWSGQLRLDYIDRAGTRIGVVWVHVGDRFADAANAVEHGSFDVVDVHVRRQLNLNTDLFLSIENVLNEDYAFWPGYPGRNTRVRGGVEHRF